MATEIKADLQSEFAMMQDCTALPEGSDVVLTMRANAESVRIVLPLPVAKLFAALLPIAVGRASRDERQ